MVLDVTGGGNASSPSLLPQAGVQTKQKTEIMKHTAMISCHLIDVMQTSLKLLFSLLLVRSNKQLDVITEKLIEKEEVSFV